jgi:hypothetical protein
MKQKYPFLSHTHLGVFVFRVVFFITILATIVFAAIRIELISSAANAPSVTKVVSARAATAMVQKSLYASPAHASLITSVCTTDPVVVNNSDSGAGSLRQAIADACDGSTITFNIASVSSPISLTSAELSISQNLSIAGPGVGALAIQRSANVGTPQFRIFNIVTGTVAISGMTITNGNAPDGAAGGTIGDNGFDGGGIQNAGTLTISNVSIVGNKAGNGGTATFLPGTGGKGGGVSNSGTLTMTASTISGNNAGNGASGGTGSGGGRGGEGGGIFSSNGSSMTLTNVTISSNTAGSTTETSAFGGSGGAIYNATHTIVQLTNCTLSGNSSGDATGPSGTAGFAGGVYNNGDITILSSTINNNLTHGPGGGLHNRGSSTMVVNNSTVSGNSADWAGGVFSEGTLRLTNSTITNNSASVTSGIFTYIDGSAEVRNTIIAGNNDGPDLEGPFTTRGNNLIGRSDGTNGFTNGLNGDQVGTPATPLDPRLAPLANNGGTTQTHAPLADSAAVDAGNNCILNDTCSPSLGSSLTSDQRGVGFARSTDGDGNGTATVDIGASEVQTILVTNTSDSGAGSLRQAITDANATPGTDAINFQDGLSGTISLTTELPLLSTSLKLNGPGANLMNVARSGAAVTNFAVFTIYSGPSNVNVWVTISGLTISGGTASGVKIIGTLTMNNCVITNNSNPGGGGGIINGFGPEFGSLTLNNCTVSNNNAVQSGGGINNGAPLTINNSTISGNHSDLHGGGIVVGSHTVIIINTTMTNNRADLNNDTFGAGGGMSQSGGGTRILRNTIVAGNFRGTGAVRSDLDLAASPTSSFNLIGDGTGMSGIVDGVNGNQVGTFQSPIDPRLGPLANNGGPTLTHALLASSPALDRGSNSLADSAGLTTDQRGPGFIRKADSADADTTQTADIGAFEAQASVEDISDKSVAENSQLSFSFNVGDAARITSVTASSSTTTLLPNLPANLNVTGTGSSRTLNITPANNQFGSSILTVTVSSGLETVQDTFVLTVTAVTNTPSVTSATTNEDTQTTSGLVITRNAADGSEVTHFKITAITNGTVFKDNGITQIANGDFITEAEGNLGLRFTPAANLSSPATAKFGFSVQAATDGSGTGLSSSATAVVTVNPVADFPSVTSATTTVNTQSTSGLVITRNVIDGPEISHFKISNISNGTLFKNNGTTQITDDSFITNAEANAGLRFTPAHNLDSNFSSFSFQVQGAASSGGAGLGQIANALITVNCGSNVVTNTNDSGPGSLRSIINSACPEAIIIFNIPTSDPGFSGGVYTITLTSGDLVIDKHLNILGPGSNTVTVKRSTAPGTPDFRIFTINSGNTATITGLSITNGKASSTQAVGGGIFNEGTLTLTDCKVFGNAAGNGGGIQNIATLTVNNSSVTGNTGGGILNHYIGNQQATAVSTLMLNKSIVSGNNGFAGIGNDAVFGARAIVVIKDSSIFGNSDAFGWGGGASNFSGDGGVVTMSIINSTISGNSSNGGGGGIVNSSGNAATATLNITNSTISGNHGTEAGGIYQNRLDALSTLSTMITDSTITSNSATGPGAVGGILITPSNATNSFTLRNTIVAGNSLNSPATPSDLQGAVDPTSSFNLIGNGAGVTGISNASSGNQIGTAANPVNALLGPLTNNDGPTMTHLLLPSSPAINAGSNGLLPMDTFDLDNDNNTSELLPFEQRGFGFNRVVNGTVDIGAVEINYTLSATAGTPQNANINTVFGTPLQATVKESGNNQSGLTVRFTAPLTGASGSFPGNTTFVDAITNASGVATAPPFNANGIAGSYNVGASIGSLSANFALTNAVGVTTTAVTSSANPSDFGQTVIFTAIVSSGSGTPQGSVQFKDGGATLGSPQTLVSGMAQLTTSSLAIGTHTITADYSGDSNFQMSSGTLAGGQVVKAQPMVSINDVSVVEGNTGTTNLQFNVSLAATSGLMVKVDYATADGTATTADNDYVASTGTLIFNPGELAKTVTVVVKGDLKPELDETVLVNLSNPVNSIIADFQGVGTLTNDELLQLILEEPSNSQAAALESLLFLRDPFPLHSVADWLNLGADRNTSVMVFVVNLALAQGEPASAVTVRIVDSMNQTFDIPAENVNAVRDQDFTQIVFSLPDGLAAGPCTVTVKAHGQTSNAGTIRIVP